MTNLDKGGKPMNGKPSEQQPTLKSLQDLNEAPELPQAVWAEADAAGATLVPYAPDQVAAFIQGHITLGDLEGVTKADQYKLAEKGHQLLEEGKLDDAKIVFEGLLALDPYDAYYLTALGSIAQRTEQLREAEHFYSRALTVNPYAIAAWANRGEVRIHLGQLVEAAGDLAKAIDLDPEGANPIGQRARLIALTVAKMLNSGAKGPN